MKVARAQPVAYEDMFRQLLELVKELVFDPVAELARAGAPDEALLNSRASDLEDLVYAIRVGRVSYADGVFSGEFRAATTRALTAAGARWEQRRGVYLLKDGLVPSPILSATVTAREQQKQVYDAVMRKLDEIQGSLPGLLERRRVSAARTVAETERGLKESAPGVKIEALSDTAEKTLADMYQRTIERPIKDWTVAATERLRRDVADMAGRGYRADALVSSLRKNYGESRRHAEFIARQETSLFQADFRRVRFAEAGVTEYMWRITRDERTRASHKALNGRIFRYDQPPITDPRTGARGNPGQPYNCRCADIPVIPEAR